MLKQLQTLGIINFRFFIPCIFYICYNTDYQQMRLFVLCLHFLFLVFSLHVSGLHGPTIRGVTLKHVGKRREKGNKDIVQKVASVGNPYCNKFRNYFGTLS